MRPEPRLLCTGGHVVALASAVPADVVEMLDEDVSG